MSLASVGYRQVEAIVQKWTNKYQYHISLHDSKPQQVKFMVEFSLPQPHTPVPNATVRVYFTCSAKEGPVVTTFRFEKDSLIHSPDKTIRAGEIEKWIDDALAKKLLVRETVFYLGTAYESSRVKSQRQADILKEEVVPPKEEWVFVHPDLLADQKRLIEVMEKPTLRVEEVSKQLLEHFNEADKDKVGVITRQEFSELVTKIGVKLAPAEQKELLSRADPDDSGLVEYAQYTLVAKEFFEGLFAKRDSDKRLEANYQEEVFSSILVLINDDVQDIEDEIIQLLKAKDEDEKGVTNISEVKTVLDEINKKCREQNKTEPLNAVQLADIAKVITDTYGYKEIPYKQIHRHIVDYKIKQLSLGRVDSRVNNLEAYLQDLFLGLDPKKTGRVKVEALEQALGKGQKIRLTRSQLYLLKSLVGVDGKGDINYTDNLKIMGQLIKRLYLCSSKKQ